MDDWGAARVKYGSWESVSHVDVKFICLELFCLQRIDTYDDIKGAIPRQLLMTFGDSLALRRKHFSRETHFSSNFELVYLL